MKDMNSTVDLYRANAVRVLCQIVDSQLLAQIERYLKQAVVDKSPVVAASVLCCACHLMGTNGDIIKRWVNEVQEAVQVRGLREDGGAWGECQVLAGLCAAPQLDLPHAVTRLLQLADVGVRQAYGRCTVACECAHAVMPPAPPRHRPAAQSKHPMVQFHAVALLHALRATDRLAVSKLVSQLTKAAVKSPMAQCLLVRYVAQVRSAARRACCVAVPPTLVLRGSTHAAPDGVGRRALVQAARPADRPPRRPAPPRAAQVVADSTPGPNGEARPFYDFLESCLRHKGELVRCARAPRWSPAPRALCRGARSCSLHRCRRARSRR